MDTVTGTLTDFLLERISEDEAEARRSFQFLDGPSEPPTWISAKADPDAAPGQAWSRPGALWDSGRVLAECEAKRRIVELAEEASGLDDQVDSEWRVGHRDLAEEPYVGDLILRALAAVYADHPDYRPEWRP